jgi:hypothetical protein
LKFAAALLLELVLKVLDVQKVEVGLLCLLLLDGVRVSFGVMSSVEDDLLDGARLSFGVMSSVEDDLLDGARLSFGVMSSVEDDYECGDAFVDKALLLLDN